MTHSVEETLSVPGISSASCAKRAFDTLDQVAGVVMARVSVKQQAATVRYDPAA